MSGRYAHLVTNGAPQSAEERDVEAHIWYRSSPDHYIWYGLTHDGAA